MLYLIYLEGGGMCGGDKVNSLSKHKCSKQTQMFTVEVQWCLLTLLYKTLWKMEEKDMYIWSRLLFETGCVFLHLNFKFYEWIFQRFSACSINDISQCYELVSSIMMMKSGWVDGARTSQVKD